MNFFLHKIINQKKYLMITFFTVLLIGFIFGLFKYQYCSSQIISFFQTLFFIEKEQIEYPIYLMQNIFLIFVNTYLSSSYLGFIAILFSVFLKGIQIAFSFIYILTLSITPLSIFLVILQLILEIVLMITLFFPNMMLSIQTFIVTFLIKDNFNYKSIINYNLNSIICVLIIFMISLFVRVYLINLI